MSARFLPRERDGPDGRLALQQFDAAPRSGDRQPACELPFQPRNRAEDSADARRPADEWVAALLAAGVPAAPILDYEEALDSEQARARNMVMEIEHPVEGTVKALGFPVKLSGTPQQVRYPAPLLGQHTNEVFASWLDRIGERAL